MTIETAYGTIDYEEENLIIFSDGLFGFPHLKRYLFLSLDENEDSMLLMVSVDESEVGFVLVNPFVLCPDYTPEMTPQELACLSAKEIGDLSCYSICVQPLIKITSVTCRTDRYRGNFYQLLHTDSPFLKNSEIIIL